jgi:hypothetical protein
MPFPPNVDAAQGAEISVKLTLVSAGGKKKEVKLLTSEGRGVDYGDFTVRSYVDSVDSSYTSASNQPAIHLSTLKTGMGIRVEPGHLNGHNEVPVRFKVDDSTLASLGDFTFEGNTIQLPDIQTETIDQTVLMKAGKPVSLRTIGKGPSAITIEAVVDFNEPNRGPAASVSVGETCAPNGIISMRGGDPAFCKGGVWTVAQYVPVGAAPKRD